MTSNVTRHVAEEAWTAAGRKRMECSCGWDGPTRAARADLDSDRRLHLSAHPEPICTKCGNDLACEGYDWCINCLGTER